jgi:hypothetical protein
MLLPQSAASVHAFHLVKLGNDTLTEIRQRLTQQVHGRRGRPIDPVRATADDCFCAQGTPSRTGHGTG